MRTNRIYSDAALDRDAPLPRTLELDQRAAHYLGTVLRQKPGDSVTLFDGEGGEFEARIDTLERKQATIELLQFKPINRDSPLNVDLGLAVSRGDRMDYALQKATELGVHAIHPLITQRTEVRLRGDKLQKRIQHWQGVIVAACEQCGLNVLPRLHTPLTLEDWQATLGMRSKCLFDPRGETLSLETAQALNTENGLALAIGPEGGFDDRERTQLDQAGFRSYSLGPRTLRTETAPVTALSILQFAQGDLGARSP